MKAWLSDSVCLPSRGIITYAAELGVLVAARLTSSDSPRISASTCRHGHVQPVMAGLHQPSPPVASEPAILSLPGCRRLHSSLPRVSRRHRRPSQVEPRLHGCRTTRPCAKWLLFVQGPPPGSQTLCILPHFCKRSPFKTAGLLHFRPFLRKVATPAARPCAFCGVFTQGTRTV